MASASAILSDHELAELAAAVGRRSFDRGGAYARRGRVMRVQWDADAEALRGTVVGQGGLYETAAFFAAGADGTFVFAEGECSCPVGFNCKHVAALVIAAVSVPKPFQGRAAPPAESPAWEQPLRALIGSRSPQVAADPLAIELSLQTGGQGPPRLIARLMRPGARGGWANGSLTWSALDTSQLRSGPYRSDQLTLLKELSALQRAGAERHSHY